MENKKQNELPRVSILTLTTKTRDNFIVSMVRNVLRQDYDHSLIEWVVIGDGDEESMSKFKEYFNVLPNISCRYITCNIEKDIGKKRNFACENAKFKIMCNMDSDDFYNKEYISHSINVLSRTKSGIVGCRDMLIFYPQIDGKMIMIRGSSIHEATMVFTKNHWRQFKFASGMSREGSQMVNGKYFNEVNILKVMICVAHDSNSYDKKQFFDRDEVELSTKHKEMMKREFSFVMSPDK